MKLNFRRFLAMFLSIVMVAGMLPAAVFAEDGVETQSESYVAQVAGTSYATFDEALAAASAFTGDVTVEIYDKVTLNKALSGSYSSITFVGKDADAEIYLEVQGYITATGKKVAFENLILSKSAGGFITNAGFMNVAFGVYDVNEVTYTNCTFANGAYASSGVVTFTGCTFKRSHDKYGLWAYGDVECTVDDCTFADYRGIKMYAEGAAKTVDLTVKDTDFSAVNDKPAIVLTYGESVTLKGNTYSSTGVFELDLDGAPNGTAVSSTDEITCVNDNGACGVLVDGKIYTTVAQAAAVAESGSTVTLLYNSTETVELAEGVTLDKNGYTADGVTVNGSAPTGTVTPAYTSATTIWGEATGNASESFAIKLYSGDILLVTATLNDPSHVIIDGNIENITWNIPLNNEGTDSWWTVVWTNYITFATQPTKVVAVVDGVEVAENTYKLNSPDDLNKIYAAVADADGKFTAYYTDIQEAIVAAAPAGTVELLADVTVDEWIMIAESLSIGNDDLITCVIDGMTIDGNGYTLTIDSIESAGNGGRLFFDATKLNIKDLTIKYADGLDGAIGLKAGTIENVTFEGCVYGVIPQSGDVVIQNCTFKTTGTSIYFEEERDGLTVTGCTFENADTVNVILLRGNVNFTNNTIVSGRTVNVVSGSPVVTGNDFNNVRLKVYNGATATISDNTINVLAFNDESEVKSTFTSNTLSVDAQAVFDAANFPVTVLSGEGTEANPYLINNQEELIWFRDKVDEQAADGSTQFAGKYFKLTDDINLAGINWNPIGSMSGDHGSFKGVFDGDGHTIYNLNVQQPGNGLGLFARTTGNAEIKNLTLNNVTVKSTDNSDYVGGLVGNSYASTKITNVHVTGKIDISGKGYIGGISGHGYVVMDNVSVTGTGTISSTFWCAGGILGYGGEGATNIMNAHVEGITITSAAGGLGAIVGMAEDNNGTQPISGSNLSAKNVAIKTYTGAYGDGYANNGLGYLYGGNPTSKLTGTNTVENVTIETSTGVTPAIVDAVASIGEAIYFDLQSAVNAAQADNQIKVLRSVTINALTIPTGASVDLDLNGKTLNGYIAPCTPASLTISNGSIKNSDSSKSAIEINAGTLALTNVNIESARHGVRIDGVVTATIDGGEYTLTSTSGTRHAVNVSGAAEVTISDGTFVGPKGTAADSGSAVCVQAGATVSIEGGSYSGGKNNTLAAAGTLTVTGGTFDQDPTAYVASGYEAVEAGGGYTVVKSAVPVAELNGVQYTSLQDAIDKAQNNDTITFLTDITENVTISKNLTIDGADKTYTGTMNVTANITIKNVNFDGKGYNGYAVETRGAYIVVIEDCTAKNYGYGFLQIVSNNDKTTLKNVTISDMNYGVKVDYSNAVVLENVDLDCSVAGLLNSNYGTKTITIKNSDISILGTWTRNNTTKTNYVFEGENSIETFKIDAAIDNFKLSVGATLTAPNDITVTTDVANSTVKYVDGTYKVAHKAIEVTYADSTVAYFDDMLEAVPDKTNYDILQDATIKLLANVTGKGIRFMETGMVLDLNGYTYTINNATGSKDTNTSGFQIRGEASTATIKNGTIQVAEPDDMVENTSVIWMFNSYSADFTVENVTIDCTNMAWEYGENCYVHVSRSGDNTNFTGTTKVINFDSEVAGNAINVGGTMTIGENVVPGGAVELDADATLTAPEALDVTTTVANSMVKYENGTYKVVPAVAKIGNTYYETFAAALDAVQDGDTITLLEVEGSEISKEIEFTREIEFTITGTAPNYALPIVTFQNATVNIEDATILIPELDARQNATINVIDSTVYDAGGNSIVKSYYNGAINISGTSVVYTMQVTTMGYITISDTAKLNATWQTNVYGNGMITVKEDAQFNTAALQLTGKEYSGRDNTDADRVGQPATIVVDGATFIVGSVKSSNGADYSYNSSSYGVNIGTIEGKSAVLDIKNGATVQILIKDGSAATVGADGTVRVNDSTLNGVNLSGAGTTEFCNTVNFCGDNVVNTTKLDGSPFHLIVNKGATLLITRFVLGYDRAITVYGEIENAHVFDPTGKTPSLKFNSTSGVGVGGTGTGKLTVEDAYIELGNSSWKNAQGTYTWSFENSYVSAASFTNCNAPSSDSASWTVTFDDSVLAAKNYIKNGVRTTYNFINGSVATTGSMRIDGELYIDETSSVTTTSYQNNTVGAQDEHGDITGTVKVDGTLTIGSNAALAVELRGGELHIGSKGKVNLTKCPLTIDADSKVVIDATGMSAGAYAGLVGTVVNNGTIEVIKNDKLTAKIDDNGNIVLVKKTDVAKIGEQGFTSFAEAIAAAKSGDTIVLLADITEDVTIDENLTIDGAKKKYTGTMTVNAGLTVTVENVNFVNGGFAKTTKSTTGTYTIKKCTFVDDGAYNYSFIFKGANEITIEDCTVKGYKYSFLYITAGTNKVSVKNVTVEDCPNYAVYFASGVNSATIENLTVKNSNNGFIINNTANRALNIKNCTMENVTTAINHSKGTNAITCTVLGVNDFGAAVTSEYAKYVLGATDATLTAPEGLNVTTTVDGYEVKYADGKYTVVEKATLEDVFAGTTVLYGNELALNFYIKRDVTFTDGTNYYAKVSHTYADGSINEFIIQKDSWSYSQSNQMFYITVDDIAAKEMNDTITIQIFEGESDNGTAISVVRTDSIQQYATRRLKASALSEKEKTCIVDMLYYGAAAQTHFEYDVDNLATKELTVEQKSYASADVTMENHKSDTVGVKHKGSTASFEDNILLNLYYNKDLIFDKVVVTYTDHYDQEHRFELTKENGDIVDSVNGTRVIVDSLVLADVNTMVKCDLYNGTTLIGSTIDSIGSYLARIIPKTTDADELMLYKKAANFTTSAYAYLHEN